MKYRDSAVADGLQLLALTGLALAAPQLDILGRNPGFLVAHRMTPAGIGSLVGTLVLAPPCVLWLILRLMNRVDSRLARGLRLALVGVLTAVFSLPAVGRVPGLPGTAAIALAAFVGVGAGFAFARRRGARLFVACLAPLPIVVAVSFLLRPEITRLLRSPEPAEATSSSGASDTPVVLIIFDELPTTSLLDEGGLIDAERYPNFAGLAEHATWLRNATTVAASTSLALPAILTGNYPGAETLATAADHPHNLFTLLGDDWACTFTNRDRSSTRVTPRAGPWHPTKACRTSPIRGSTSTAWIRLRRSSGRAGSSSTGARRRGGSSTASLDVKAAASISST